MARGLSDTIAPAPTIRRVTGDQGRDSAVVQSLARVFREARRARLQFSIDLHTPEEDRHFLSSVVLPTQEVYVAEAGDEVVGFVAFTGGWVHHLYVAPPLQRRGVGRRLLDVAKASGPSLQLWVFAINRPAITFYEREGFRVVERTDGAANEARMPDVRMAWPA